MTTIGAPMNRLLVLSCSQNKQTLQTTLPAIQRYDGPAFRLLRRYLKDSTDELEVFILSAEFGLIPHGRRIPFYDRRMTGQRARELKLKVASQAQRLFAAESPKRKRNQQLFINLGRDYLCAFEPAFTFLTPDSNITMASGAMGKRLAEMHDWLYGADSALRQPTSIESVKGRATLRGIEIELTKDQVLALALDALKQEDEAPFSYQSWYIQIDDIRVSPKWLVSKLTELPVSAFHSDDARRVLHELGLEVVRV